MLDCIYKVGKRSQCVLRKSKKVDYFIKFANECLNKKMLLSAHYSSMRVSKEL